jgi:putative copper resistance protein D
VTTAGPRPADLLRPAGWSALAVVSAAVAAVVAGAAGAVLAGVVATRAGADAAGVACVGAALVVVLLPAAARTRHDAARVRSAADRALVALGGAWAVLVLTGVVLRTADAVGRAPATVTADELLRWSLRLTAGRGMLLTAGCALAVLVCAAVRLRDPERVPPRVLLVVALLGVLAPTVTGHAGSEPDHQLAVVTTALHAGAAALWVGGLGGLLVLVARYRALLAGTLPRFSRLAGACVVAVALTGVAGAAIRMPGWDALLGTGYGLLVVAKTVGLVALAGLGGLARRRLAEGRLPVLRWAGLEVALMAVVLGLAAALTQTAP